MNRAFWVLVFWLMILPVSARAVVEIAAPVVAEGEVRSISNEMRKDKIFYYRFRIKVDSKKAPSSLRDQIVDGYIPVRAMDLLAKDQDRMVGAIVQVEMLPEDGKNAVFQIKRIKILR